MLMSLQQRFLLDVLKRLGCVKRKQLYLLAAKNLSLPEWKVEQRHVDIMLNQLGAVPERFAWMLIWFTMAGIPRFGAAGSCGRDAGAERRKAVGFPARAG
jgi:hypothetical protein